MGAGCDNCQAQIIKDYEGKLKRQNAGLKKIIAEIARQAELPAAEMIKEVMQTIRIEAESKELRKQITDIVFDLSSRIGNMVPNTPHYEALTGIKEDLAKLIGL